MYSIYHALTQVSATPATKTYRRGPRGSETWSTRHPHFN